MLPPSWKSELKKLVLEENHREEQSKQTTQDADITAGLVAIKQQLETANEQQASAESRQKRFDVFTALLFLLPPFSPAWAGGFSAAN